MSKRPAKPADMGWVTPYLIVRDADAAMAFYAKAFGLKTKMSLKEPDGKTAHAEMTWETGLVMFGPEGDRQPCKSPKTLGIKSPVHIYVYCEDVDALHKQAVAAGAVSEQAPETMFYGDRTCHVTDPDGHSWYFATNVADFDPSKAPK